jgi:general secretion pathway protein J
VTRRARGGFTLIEMMVALALVSLMSIAMLQAYRFSQRALAQTTRVDAAARDVAGAQRLLRRLIEQAYPFETPQTEGSAVAPRGLSGDATRLALSAPAPAVGGIGLYRYAFALGESDAADRFEVSWTLDRNGAGGAAPASKARSEALIEGVQSISIAYLELVELGNGQIEPNWRDEWIDKRAMPALVRIRVTFAPGDPRHWPELVVAPRVSADANCVFDVVSQMCRIAA